MKVKTLIELLGDYDPDDRVRVDEDGCLLIGGKGGFLIRLPVTQKKNKRET